MDSQETLLDQFVGTFDKLCEMAEYADIYPIVAELAVGEPDQLGQTPWKPLSVNTEGHCLDPLYAKLPARFPPLFERLLLSYRWAEVDLLSYTLLPNPPGPDLSRFFEQISKDRGLWESLIPAGYMQFAKGADYDYDPICFDIKSRTKNGDCRIVKIDHEEILCNNRVKVVAELASSFEELVRQTIRLAADRRWPGDPTANPSGRGRI
jgi:hypothetical protein